MNAGITIDANFIEGKGFDPRWIKIYKRGKTRQYQYSEKRINKLLALAGVQHNAWNY